MHAIQSIMPLPPKNSSGWASGRRSCELLLKPGRATRSNSCELARQPGYNISNAELGFISCSGCIFIQRQVPERVSNDWPDWANHDRSISRLIVGILARMRIVSRCGRTSGNRKPVPFEEPKAMTALGSFEPVACACQEPYSRRARQTSILKLERLRLSN